MTKVTYLLGAGASAEVLPLAKSISDGYTGVEKPGLGKRMLLMATEVETIIDELSEKDRKFAKIFIENLQWLYKEANEHGTVDTFAKKLSLQEDNFTLRKLKTTLSLFLIIEQRTKGFDKRYSSFFASILEKNNKGIFIPPTIKILTWNYDIQLEMAFQYYFRKNSDSDIESIQISMQSIPNAKSLLNQNPVNASVIHLNGIAGLYSISDNKTGHIFDRSHNSKSSSLFEALSHNLFFLNSLLNEETIKIDQTFQFAWENGVNKSHPTLSNVKELTSGTEFLVIIGYSFPFFNRSVDRDIFDTMKNSLKKIYFQDPILDGTFLKAQFNLSENIEIDHIKETNQFFLPHEL